MYMAAQAPHPRPRLTRAEQQAATRAALIDAAAQVFAERGFTGASVEAIAARAGYTRGAFYSNFESKEELFAELLQERVYARYGEMAERAAFLVVGVVNVPDGLGGFAFVRWSFSRCGD